MNIVKNNFENSLKELFFFLQQKDLIIEVIYADVIRGKLDQKHQQLEVDYAIGRDTRPENLSEMVSVLEEWYNNLKCWSADEHSKMNLNWDLKSVVLKLNYKISRTN